MVGQIHYKKTSQGEEPHHQVEDDNEKNDHEDNDADNDNNQPRRRSTQPGWDNVVVCRSDPNIDNS